MVIAATSFAPGLGVIAVLGIVLGLGLLARGMRGYRDSTRLVDTVTTGMLLKVVQSHRIDPQLLITHHFSLAQIDAAYETFGQAARNKALKVIISA